MVSVSDLWTPPSGRLAALTDNDKEQLELLGQLQLDPKLVPLADEIQQRVPIYSASKLSERIRSSPEGRHEVQDEVHRVLSIGPGFFVVRGMVPTAVIDRTEEIAKDVHAKWPAKGGGAGSMRTSAFIEKHAVTDPESYADYYGNEVLSAIAEAWLGPAYKILTDLNSVSRGNTQPIHRDYPVSHLPTDRIPSYPIMNQMASQLQTLQGAVAHTDMPLETGPTRIAPFSHQLQKGYMAIKRDDYIAIADKYMSQLALKKGDAVIFNPACFHQPGLNETDNARQACLFQISCAWNVQMELLDKAEMTKAAWPVIKRWAKELGVGKAGEQTNGHANGHANGHKERHISQLDALIAATCDDFGYPYNWRTVKSQQTQAQLIREALESDWSDEEVFRRVDENAAYSRF